MKSNLPDIDTSNITGYTYKVTDIRTLRDSDEIYRNSSYKVSDYISIAAGLASGVIDPCIEEYILFHPKSGYGDLKDDNSSVCIVRTPVYGYMHDEALVNQQ